MRGRGVNYRLDLRPAARADLARLPRSLRLVAGNALLDLAENPVGKGRPAVFPYPSGSLVSHVIHDEGHDFETWHGFTILFRFGQDEQTLVILGIGHVEYPRET